jgi:hypothetical protein
VNGSGLQTYKFAYFNGTASSGVLTLNYIIDSQANFSRTGLVSWYRADGVVTSGSNVTQWTDLAPNPNHAVQDSGFGMPTTTTINGKPAVHFTSSANQHLIATPNSGNTKLELNKFTIMAVARRTSGINSAIVTQKGASGDFYGLRLNSGPTLAGYIKNGNGTFSATQSIGNGNLAVLATTYDPTEATPKLQVYLNGTVGSPQTVTQTVNTNLAPLYIGGADVFTTLDGDISEVMIFNRVLTDSERKQVEFYLFARYGITNSNLVPIPSTEKPSGIYGGPITIDFGAIPSGVTLRYTTNGSPPQSNSLASSGQITVNSSQTLTVAFFNDATGASSGTKSWTYIIDPQVNFDQDALGLVSWYRGDTVVLSGSNVTQWTDMRGTPLNAVQGPLAGLPTATTINGKPAVHFSSSGNQFMTVTPSATNTKLELNKFTIMAVARKTAGTNNAVVAQKGASGDYYGLRLDNGPALTGYIKNGNGTFSTSQSIGNGNLAVLATTYDPAAATPKIQVYLNGAAGTPQTVTQTVNTNLAPLYIGGADVFTTLDGDIAEVLIFNRVLTDAERQQVELYLFTRYGITTAAAPIPSAGTQPSGIYTGPQTINFGADPAGVTLKYTTDGTTPAPGSPVYGGQITVNTSQTYTFAYVNNATGTAGQTTTLNYVIDPQADFSRTGLVSWYRADQVKLDSNGFYVTEWPDQAPNPNNAKQNGTNPLPYLAPNDLNGKPGLGFAGAGNTQLLASAAPKLNLSNLSIVAVAKQTYGGNGILAQCSGTGDLYGLYVNSWLPTLYIKDTSHYAVGRALNPNTAVIESGIIEGIYIQPQNTSMYSSSLQVYTNGIPGPQETRAAITVSPNANNPLYVGYNFGGRVNEILIFDHALTVAERAKIETYLSNRYAISMDPDGDGLPNWQELELGTDPYNADTNGDGMLDGAEYYAGYDPTSNDVDNDNLTNAAEIAAGTNPFYNDSDGDGVLDGSDAWPLDPTSSTFTDPTPSVAPTITLELPTNAVLVP